METVLGWETREGERAEKASVIRAWTLVAPEEEERAV
jgi:hypothetical protein